MKKIYRRLYYKLAENGGRTTIYTRYPYQSSGGRPPTSFSCSEYQTPTPKNCMPATATPPPPLPPTPAAPQALTTGTSPSTTTAPRTSGPAHPRPRTSRGLGIPRRVTPPLACRRTSSAPVCRCGDPAELPPKYHCYYYYYFGHSNGQRRSTGAGQRFANCKMLSTCT